MMRYDLLFLAGLAVLLLAFVYLRAKARRPEKHDRKTCPICRGDATRG